MSSATATTRKPGGRGVVDEGRNPRAPVPGSRSRQPPQQVLGAQADRLDAEAERALVGGPRKLARLPELSALEAERGRAGDTFPIWEASQPSA